MIWRAAAILAVLFWAVMSGLLVRDVYFPDASRFATLPPKVVVDLFLRQSDTFGSSLQLYHHRERIGHATFQVSRRIKPNHATVYDILARGVVERQDAQERRAVEATWNVACILADAERWQHLKLEASFPARAASVRIAWQENEATPDVLVKQGQQIIMNSKDVKKLIGSGEGGTLALLSMLGGMPNSNTKPSPDQTHLNAREGLMTLAGRERKCYVLELPLFGQHEVTLLFTEAGELARIDLPDGYSLLEPTIHGLQEGTR